jgi:hypothetical protein
MSTNLNLESQGAPHITYKVSGVSAPEDEPQAIYIHNTNYMFEIKENKSTVEQLRELEKMQGVLLRTVEDLAFRFPVSGVRPCVHLEAELGTMSERSDTFGLALEQEAGKRGYWVRWPLRDGEGGRGEEFCADAAAVTRRVKVILETYTNPWLLTFTDETQIDDDGSSKANPS